MPVHPSPAAVLAVTALVRGRERLARASDAERRLVRTVAEWEPGAGLDLTMRCARDGRRVHVEALALGQAPAGWHADIAHAFAPVAQVSLRRRSSRAIPPPIRLAELVRDPLRANRRLEEWPSPQGATGAADVSWPMPVRELADDPAVALRGIPGGFIRTLVAAATPLEISMLHEEMRETWDWMTHPHRDPYFGTPVRLRTFVGVRGEAPRFASLRASVRGWGTGLVLRDADAAERSRFDTLRPDALAGHVRPEGWALAALRLPAAGEQPTPGIVSVVPPVAERPIDTVSAASVDALVLGTAVTATGRRVPVRIDAADLCRHAFVEGRSGAGKTSFLTRVIAELAERGIGSTLLEHHGTGVDAALRALPADAAERALVVRHGDPFAHGTLNLFSDRDPGAREQTIAEFIELMQAMFDPRGEGIVGPRWRRWFSLLCEAVCAYFGDAATILHLVSIATEPARAQRLAKRLLATHPDLARRLHREVGSLSGDEASNLPAWAVSKLQPLVSQSTMREIVGRPRDSVDVVRAIDERRTVLVDLAGTTLGTDAARMLAAMWLLKHWVAMGRRAERAQPHVLLFDEAHLMKAGALASMLAEARKYGIGVILAGQSIDALAPSLQLAVEGNVGSFFSFRLGLATAPRASARLAGWPVEELVRLPDLRAATTLSQGGVQGEPFLLTVTAPDTGSAGRSARAAAIEERCAQRWVADASPVVTDDDVDAALSESPRPVRTRHASPSPRRSVADALGSSVDAAGRSNTGTLPSAAHAAAQAPDEDLPAFIAEWLDARTATAG